MKRFRHLLQRSLGKAYPTQCVVLACDYLVVHPDHTTDIEIDLIDRWIARGFSGSAGVYGESVVRTGDNAGRFWSALSDRLAKGGMLWLFAWHASRFLSASGAWELFEQGDWRICGGDYRERVSRRNDDVPSLSGDVAGVSEQHSRRGSPAVPPVRADDSVANGGVSRRTSVQSGQKSGAVVIECPPLIVDFRKVGLSGTCRIVDLENYGLPSPLRSTSASELALSGDLFVREMIGVLKNNNMGGLKATSGSQATASWRHGYLTHNVLCHSCEPVLNLEQRAYVGGRCEAFHLGVLPGEIIHLDVSSMYVAMYKDASLPAILEETFGEVSVAELAKIAERRQVIADVTVETNEPAYPKKDARLGVTVYPIGRFTTTLCGRELQDAIARGRVRSCKQLGAYSDSHCLGAFGACLDGLLNNPGLSADGRRFVKSVGTNLVGKFGQVSRFWQSEHWPGYCEAWDRWQVTGKDRETERWRSVAGHTQREHVEGWAFDAVPSIAAWVCSLARHYLLTMIRCAHWGDVFYCDTDSLFVSQDGYRRLCDGGFVRPGETGYLRIKKRSERVVIYGIKSYEEDGQSVQAGRPLDSHCRTSDGQRAWIGQRVVDSCRTGSAPQPIRHSIVIDQRETYRHGTRMVDGSVRPLEYDER